MLALPTLKVSVGTVMVSPAYTVTADPVVVFPAAVATDVPVAALLVPPVVVTEIVFPAVELTPHTLARFKLALNRVFV